MTNWNHLGCVQYHSLISFFKFIRLRNLGNSVITKWRPLVIQSWWFFDDLNHIRSEPYFRLLAKRACDKICQVVLSWTYFSQYSELLHMFKIGKEWLTLTRITNNERDTDFNYTWHTGTVPTRTFAAKIVRVSMANQLRQGDPNKWIINTK